MSQLTIYDESQPVQSLFDSTDYAQICSELDRAGVRFER